MAMVIDATDLLYAHSMDAFAIVSSDADFTPLAMRILTDGKKVYGFGEQKTPEPFVNACSTFTYVEGLVQPSDIPDEGSPQASVPINLRSDARLIQMLRNAVDASRGDGGWAPLARVGNQINNQASFDPRNYGHGRLSDLVEATALFDIERRDQGVFVRAKAAKTAKAVKTAKTAKAAKPGR
jgi:uncharacterized LabA/DUF88 family protein